MKYLSFLLIPLSFWACAIFNKVTGLSIYPQEWYSFPLFLTYCCVIIASVIAAVIIYVQYKEG